MQYLGDYAEDDTLYFCFNTNDKNGASIAPSVAGTIKVYKDTATGTETEAGVTVDMAYDTIVGVHNVEIVLTNAFYVVGSDYHIILTDATIDGETVHAVLATFSIENRYARGTDSAALASGVDVTKIHGTAITESTSGNVAANFSTFYDNDDDSSNTSIVSDIIAMYAAQDSADVLLRALLDANLMTTTTVATLASQISFTLSAGSPDDDAYNDCMVVLKSVSTPARKAIGFISDYAGETKTVTLAVATGIFTLEVGDEISVVAIPWKSVVDIKKLARTDKVIDTSATPWVVNYNEEGTSTALMSKTMKNTDGDNIGSTGNLLGRLEQE